MCVVGFLGPSFFGFSPFDVSVDALKPRPPPAGLVRGGCQFARSRKLSGVGHRHPVRSADVSLRDLANLVALVTGIQSVRRMSGPLREIDESAGWESGEGFHGSA